MRVADGCPCNSGRGVNHGLVPADVCTCLVCDPAQTGSSRAAELPAVPPPSPPPEPPPVDRDARCTVGEAIAPGVPNTEDRGDGQQRGYVVLCEAERKKGFVRPVRRSYRHVGIRPKYPTRDLTPEERDRHGEGPNGYVAFEAYPEGSPERVGSVTGRFWTAMQLRSGCGTMTTMGQALAETYARDPAFYNGTFCCGCGAHFPVGATGEFVWEGTAERVGT
jgi:hypothetical protein